MDAQRRALDSTKSRVAKTAEALRISEQFDLQEQTSDLETSTGNIRHHIAKETMQIQVSCMSTKLEEFGGI